jgi:hypothetical protein
VDIPGVLEPLLRVALDNHHPVMTLLQQMGEAADPANYARMIVSAPPKGANAKGLLISEGFVDTYTPNSTTEALATAIGVPLVGPTLAAVDALALRELTPRNLPIAGNVDTASGKTVTAGLIQLQSPLSNQRCVKRMDCSSRDYCDNGRCRPDGHFVLFDTQEGRRRYARFLATLAKDGIGTIVE